MNPSDEENQSQGPVIRDRRRIDPQTGQVRDAPGQVKPGKHSAAQQSGQHPAPPQSAPQGARAPGGGMPAGGAAGGGAAGGGAGGGGAGAPAAPGSPGAAGPVGQADAAAAAAELALAERTADLQRLQAEYANYRKRVERDRVAVREQALANVLSELLPVLDDIGRAREHGELTGGFKSVAESLEASAAKLGLTTYGEVGDPFDPTLHDALMHSYSAKVTEPTCVQILQPGYKVGDRIIRPARVAVAEPGDDTPDPGDQDE
jgi:molecular chaperone GrpE